MFNFASSFCYVIAHTYVAVHGFLKGERNLSSEGYAPSPPMTE
jgi:hypothetical protein